MGGKNTQKEPRRRIAATAGDGSMVPDWDKAGSNLKQNVRGKVLKGHSLGEV